jgi:hypothetical protein
MVDAISLLTDHVTHLEQSGYTIRGVVLQPDWCSLKLAAYQLASRSNDTIYVEAVTVVDKRNYSPSDQNLTVWKMHNSYDKSSKDSLVSGRSSVGSVAYRNKLMDSWRLSFILAPVQHKIDELTEYSFGIEALDDTRIGGVAEEKNEREMILLVYSKS